MFDYDRIVISEGIDIDKTAAKVIFSFVITGTLLKYF